MKLKYNSSKKRLSYYALISFKTKILVINYFTLNHSDYFKCYLI